MGNILITENLINTITNEVFGFIGIEIETGNVKYFSFFDCSGIFHDNELYEFDISNPSSYILKINLNNCEHKGEKISSKLQKYVTPLLIDELIEKHFVYNSQNNLPVNLLEFNKEKLTIEHADEIKDGGNVCLGGYIPLENTINVVTPKNEIEQSIYGVKIKNILTHEIGHMKVSKTQFDSLKNEILITDGFSKFIYTLDLVGYFNGFKVFGLKDTRYLSKYGDILEEVINDYECSLIDPDYDITYPNFGGVLNSLCDRKLLMARYTSSIEEYYENMKQIIPSYNLADELLSYIQGMLYPYDSKFREDQYGEALKLIKEYQKRKLR